MTDNLQIMTQLYQNLEIFRTFFCSPRPADLCTQTILLLHADPGAEIHLSCQTMVREQFDQERFGTDNCPKKVRQLQVNTTSSIMDLIVDSFKLILLGWCPELQRGWSLC